MALLVSCLLVFLGVVVRAESPLTSCTPTCDSSLVGQNITNPTNCRNYYICLADGEVSDFTVECPEAELFDNSSKACVPKAQAVCDICDPPCKFSCPATTDVVVTVADRYNCSSYYICAPNHEPVPVPCLEDTPYFNGIECTANASECCDSCLTHCPDANIEIPDPTNCTNFYFCDIKGYPDESNLYHCDVGNFDEIEGVCSIDAPCGPSCTDGGANTTTTTPPITTKTTTSTTTTSTTTTSTTTTSTTTTSTTIEPPNCSETFTCYEVGNFPKCTNRCDSHYYVCTSADIGNEVPTTKCINNKVIDPDRMLCVTPSQCPYPLHE